MTTATSSPRPRRRVTLDGDAFVSAELWADDEHVEVHLRVQSGHVPPHTRTDAVAALFRLPEIRRGERLQISTPLGETELIDGIRARCSDLSTRAAGSTCLLDGIVERTDDGQDDAR